MNAMEKVFEKLDYKMTVKVTFLEEVLGSMPNSEDIYSDYIASKAPDAESIEDEIAAIGIEGVEEKGITVFPRDEEGEPFIYDYQIRGYLKETFKILKKAGKAGSYMGKACAKLTANKQAVDTLIFVYPRQVVFEDYDDIDFCVRPLRAETPMGARVALAKSETIPAGATLTFRIGMLDEKLRDCIVEALDYGMFHGMLQWRNSGKGIFSYEILDEG